MLIDHEVALSYTTRLDVTVGWAPPGHNAWEDTTRACRP